MMRYGGDQYHELIEYNIRRAFASTGYFNAIFAKDLTPDYFSTLGKAIKGSIDICKYGIAVFSHSKGQEANPNIAFEFGIMWAQDKDVLILKDERTPLLFTDIIGKIWVSFDGTPSNLQSDANELYISCKRWLKKLEYAVENIFGFSYVVAVEESIDRDHRNALRKFEREIVTSLERVADYAGMELPKNSSGRQKALFLFKSGQLTYYFFKRIITALLLCQKLGRKPRLSEEERRDVVRHARFLREVYNDWSRYYKSYEDLMLRRRS